MVVVKKRHKKMKYNVFGQHTMFVARKFFRLVGLHPFIGI
jgi:hypothetical protein